MPAPLSPFFFAVMLALVVAPGSATTVFDHIRLPSEPANAASLLQRAERKDLPRHRTAWQGEETPQSHPLVRRDSRSKKPQVQHEAPPTEEEIFEYLHNRYRQSFDAAQRTQHRLFPSEEGASAGRAEHRLYRSEQTDRRSHTASAAIEASGATKSEVVSHSAYAGNVHKQEPSGPGEASWIFGGDSPRIAAEEATREELQAALQRPPPEEELKAPPQPPPSKGTYWDLFSGESSAKAGSSAAGESSETAGSSAAGESSETAGSPAEAVHQAALQRSPEREETSWSIFGDNSKNAAAAGTAADRQTAQPQRPDHQEGSWDIFSGSGSATAASVAAGEQNGTSRQEVTELDADCRGPVAVLPMTFSSTFNADGDSDFSAKEVVWILKHREMMPPEVADKLIDLEGKHDDKFRQVVSRFASAANASCISPSLCLGIAARILSSDESTCPRGRLLTQLMNQLESNWVNKLLSQDEQALRPRLTSKDKSLTPAQLAVKHWGGGLIVPKAAMHETILFDSNASVATQVAWGSLDNLVGALVDPGTDLPFMTRSFLLAAQRQAESLSGTNILVNLLRTLEEQRSSLRKEDLIRDAAVVDYYEPRTASLEAKVQNFDMDNPEKATAWETMQYDMDLLLEQLRRASGDHQNMLPGDYGVLPAFWMGRLERVRRQLEDRLSGREKPRPTVLIWTCSFGGGHWAATKALEQYLPDYYLVVSDPTKDREYYEGDKVGDWIRQYITPKWDETYVFNELILKHRHYKLENTMETLQAWNGWLRGDGTRFAQPCAAPLCDYQSKKFMRRAALRSAPDFMITVYHMDLLPITELAEELGRLPILHLATDIDAKMWEVWGQRPEYEHLKIGLPFGVPEARVTYQPLYQNQTFVSGYAVRPAFLGPLHTREQLAVERMKRKIPQNAVVALVMSGSEGQTIPWPAMLADSQTWQDRPLHLVIVVGGNYEFGMMLERAFKDQEQADGHQILRGSNRLVTLEVAKDPDNAADKRAAYFVPESELVTLMDIADVLLTKGGGGTTAEAAYRGLPILFDATDGMLKWEAFTATVFEQHHRGKRLIDNADLEPYLKHAIKLGKSRSFVFSNETGHEDGALINSTHRIRREMNEMWEHALRTRQKSTMPM